MSEEIILRLVDLIYMAAADASQWPTVVHSLAEVLNGTAGTLHGHQIPSQESHFSADWNIDPRAVTEYTEYFGYRNIWRFFRPNLLQTGSVTVTQELCPQEVFVKSEYYHDYLRRYDLFQAVAVTLRRDGRDFSNLTIFRPRGALMFDEAERNLLVILAPHLVRSFELHSRIQGLERKADAAADVLDQIPQAVVLFGTGGKVLMANRAATALLGIEPTLKLTRQVLVAAVPSENKRLNQLIQGVLATGMGKGFHSGGGMVISRAGLRRPLHVLVTPLRTRTIRLGKDVPVAAVFISDPEREPVSESQALSQLYGLTAAESRLALVLAAGKTIKDAAEQFGVTQSTLRSQLKSVFGKTNTNSQSQLVRLILLTPPHTSKRTVSNGTVLG
jgi:DNA-binding CsgD family transcriptional regulator/PAS domain-containing protein